MSASPIEMQNVVELPQSSLPSAEPEIKRGWYGRNCRTIWQWPVALGPMAIGGAGGYLGLSAGTSIGMLIGGACVVAGIVFGLLGCYCLKTHTPEKELEDIVNKDMPERITQIADLNQKYSTLVLQLMHQVEALKANLAQEKQLRDEDQAELARLGELEQQIKAATERVKGIMHDFSADAKQLKSGVDRYDSENDELEDHLVVIGDKLHAYDEENAENLNQVERLEHQIDLLGELVKEMTVLLQKAEEENRRLMKSLGSMSDESAAASLRFDRQAKASKEIVETMTHVTDSLKQFVDNPEIERANQLISKLYLRIHGEGDSHAASSV